MSSIAFSTSGSAAYRDEMRAPRTRLRLTPRGRAVLIALAAIPLVAGALVLGINAGGAAAGSGGTGTTFDYVTVQSGESLWQLAETIAPNADPRDVIADIISLNQLGSTDVEPGQRLAIPAQY